MFRTKSAWLQKLSSLDHEEDDEGTVWNKEARKRDADRIGKNLNINCLERVKKSLELP